MRSITEICIDADNNADDLARLARLWNEVKFTTFDRDLHETLFAREHIHEKISEAAKKKAGILILMFNGEQ